VTSKDRIRHARRRDDPRRLFGAASLAGRSSSIRRRTLTVTITFDPAAWLTGGRDGQSPDRRRSRQYGSPFHAARAIIRLARVNPNNGQGRVRRQRRHNRQLQSIFQWTTTGGFAPVVTTNGSDRPHETVPDRQTSASIRFLHERVGPVKRSRTRRRGRHVNGGFSVQAWHGRSLSSVRRDTRHAGQAAFKRDIRRLATHFLNGTTTASFDGGWHQPSTPDGHERDTAGRDESNIFAAGGAPTVGCPRHAEDTRARTRNMVGGFTVIAGTPFSRGHSSSGTQDRHTRDAARPVHHFGRHDACGRRSGYHRQHDHD